LKRWGLLPFVVAFLTLVGVTMVLAAAGPHGNYSATTDKCLACHDVHEAGTTNKLLFASTVMGTCNYCHDGSWARGVYQQIASPGADHYNFDTTQSVPGTSTASNYTGYFTCASCHTPHDSNAVNPFFGDTNAITQTYPLTISLPDGRIVTMPATTYYGDETTTSKLLKQDPNSGGLSYANYGGGWCSDCHANRHNGTSVNNHPVDTATYYYDSVAFWNPTSSTHETTRLGGSNYGYIMRVTQTADEPDPICQQCHEDSRDITGWDSGSYVNPTFSVTTVGYWATDNPQYKDFPHETVNARFKVENGDDLCLNCHPTSQLP